jgi:AAA+ ATPase superfamily predicted ATPase
LNEDERKIAFIECKWQNVDIRRSKHIVADLKRKAALVKWGNDERSEIYGIVAKKIEGKEKLREEGYLAFDLEDIV